MDVILWNSGPKNDGYIVSRTIGPYKIARSLEQASYSVQVIDHVAWFTADELYSVSKKFITNETRVLGISTTFLQYNFVLLEHVISALHRLTKEFPNLRLIFGGANVNLVRQFFIRFPKIFGMITEFGEDIAVDVVDYIYERSTSLPPFNPVVHNISIKEFNQPKTKRFDIANDSFRFKDNDYIFPNETLPLEISRGCIFKCKFCNHLMLGRGKLDYLKDIELVKEELLYNYAKWGVTNYYILCDTFNDTEFKMQLWYDMVKSLPFKIRYTAYLRADLLHRHKDVAYMLKETGLTSAFHGIESFGKEASQLVGKGWSGKEGKTFLPTLYHDIWNKEVAQTLSLIIGLPGDTKQSLFDSTDWFVDNDMYHLAWIPLGLAKNSKLKNLSEFERNAEKYGFTFPYADTDKRRLHIWENKNWKQPETIEFEKVLNAKVEPYNAPRGSWDILNVLQYGIPVEQFRKEVCRNLDSKILVEAGQNRIKEYIARLLA